MEKSRRFFLGLVLWLVLCLPFCWAEGGATLSESELQTLRTALTQADEQLAISETRMVQLESQLNSSLQECERLGDLLKTQGSQLQTLERQLDEALQSLAKLKREAVGNSATMWLIGIAGVALGGTVSYLIFGGR